MILGAYRRVTWRCCFGGSSPKGIQMLQPESDCLRPQCPHVGSAPFAGGSAASFIPKHIVRNRSA